MGTNTELEGPKIREGGLMESGGKVQMINLEHGGRVVRHGCESPTQYEQRKSLHSILYVGLH
jgi:hypothetical protein